jgi:hypothetical protein
MRAILVAILISVPLPVLADGTLSGRVVDLNNQPVADATVVVAADDGAEQSVTTGADGRYELLVHGNGSFAVVVAFGGARQAGRVAITDGGRTTFDGQLDIAAEVIEVHGQPRGVLMPKLKQDDLKIPEYSEKAILGDHWTRAWLLLDVDEQGDVVRVKFLRRPLYDLDEIAVKHALGLHFRPAIDREGKAHHMLIVWTIEWPSYRWLQQKNGVTTRMPTFLDHPQDMGVRGIVNTATFPPCRDKSGPNLESSYPTVRDCSKPDLSKADAAEPWIGPGGDIARLDGPLKPQPPMAHHVSRTPAYIATGIAATLAGGLIVSWVEYSKYRTRVDAAVASDPLTVNVGAYIGDYNRMRRWELAGLGFGTTMVVAGAFAAQFWSRQTMSVSVQGYGREGAGFVVGGTF